MGYLTFLNYIYLAVKEIQFQSDNAEVNFDELSFTQYKLINYDNIIYN